MEPNDHQIRVLVAVYWPLGGIRTYLKYVYRKFPADVQLTVLAASTQEDDALSQDMAALEIPLMIDRGQRSRFYLRIWHELRTGNYDIVQSHGFITASHAYVANLLAPGKRRHILTVHGILEDRLLGGWIGKVKRAVLGWIINHVDVVYGVGHDMMVHLSSELSGFDRSRTRKVVIKNGIDVSRFGDLDSLRGQFRASQKVPPGSFLLGFLGRFMEAKGFNFLIDAIDQLEKGGKLPPGVQVVAVGSGDYIRRYKNDIERRKLAHRFRFLPFQRDIMSIYADLDAVVMPSVSEAASLLALECLCAGVPLLASNCIGLRESVRDTPAIVFETRDAQALAEAIAGIVEDPRRHVFESFRSEAVRRFDVGHTRDQLAGLFRQEAR